MKLLSTTIKAPSHCESTVKVFFSAVVLCSYYVTAGESHQSSFTINLCSVAIVEHDWSNFLLTVICSLTF
ncbi:hypothetical protein Bca101_009965 [Brassica carinata]